MRRDLQALLLLPATATLLLLATPSPTWLSWASRRSALSRRSSAFQHTTTQLSSDFLHKTQIGKRVLQRTQVRPMAGVTAAVQGALAAAVVVYVTVPDKQVATALSQGVVKNRLAACVSAVPGVESTFWWKGKIDVEAEVLLIMKTRKELVDRLVKFVKDNHPYELPETVAVPIVGGSQKYLEWLHENTEQQQDAVV